MKHVTAARGGCIVLVTLLLAGCGPLLRSATAESSAERLARTVTITRDAWGVPAIQASSDAAAAFGLAWAQAEDDYWQLEESIIHALGRAAEYWGERHLAADLVRRAFEVERLARAEYAAEPADRRRVWDAWAAGLNHYLRLSGVQPRLITRWEPWMPFAIMRDVRAGMLIDGVRLGEADSAAFQLVGRWDEAAAGAAPEPSGSSAWAVAPARTAAGHALLFQDPDAGGSGAGRLHEAVVDSDEGWHVRGFAVLGTPVIHVGHTAGVAWTHTHSGADHADVYAVTFDHPTDPLLYRYDDGWRPATEWRDTVRVNTVAGVVARVHTFRRTHHGPIVARRGEELLAVRIARMEEGGSLQQRYALNRARDAEMLRAALDMRAVTGANTMFADTAGNIGYYHGNAVPRRPAGHDWTRPVSGNTAATEWQGYHELHELPALLNPEAGWLQNAGSTPFLATGDGANRDPARYASYMAPEPDSELARSARRLLAAEAAWTFAGWQQAVFDTNVAGADVEIARLVHEWEQVGGTNPFRAMRMDEAVDLLRAWDRVSTVESAAMTVFVLWQEQLRSGGFAGDLARFRALEEAVGALRADFGAVSVPWGEVNRLRRVNATGPGSLDDGGPSLPVPGADAWTGVIFRFETTPGPDGRRYGGSGRSAVSVVQLGAVPAGRAVVQLGQSADPRSPYAFDQAPLYARGELRDAPFLREAVRAAARRTYHPGVRPMQ